MIADNSPNQVDINSILQSLNSNNNQTHSAKPNIKMTIKKRSNNNSNRKRSKIVRCKGTLVNRGGRLVPKVKCSSKSIYGNGSSNNRRNNSRNNSRNNRYNRNENELPKNFGVHGDSGAHTNQDALSEIMREITKLRRNNKYFTSLKNKNRKKALENMILRNVIKNQRVRNLRPKKSCRKKFRIIQVPINNENMNDGMNRGTNKRLNRRMNNFSRNRNVNNNSNQVALDPELKKILKQVQTKHSRSGKKGKCKIIGKAKMKSI